LPTPSGSSSKHPQRPDHPWYSYIRFRDDAPWHLRRANSLELGPPPWQYHHEDFAGQDTIGYCFGMWGGFNRNPSANLNIWLSRFRHQSGPRESTRNSLLRILSLTVLPVARIRRSCQIWLRWVSSRCFFCGGAQLTYIGSRTRPSYMLTG
jgi:hypothetical protein